MANQGPIAVYLHTPFCPTKCGYCDFNSYAMSGDIMDRTTRATEREILASPWAGRPAKTIFFGGGTPTYLPQDQLIRLLEAVMAVHPPVAGCEITSEANPGTADADKFNAMRTAGFNRLSLGAQSFLDSDLVALGRIHSSGEIERAVELARQAGFENLNLDLMFALPDQSRHAWNRNLDRALALSPEHLSLYCLTLEANTPFYKQHLKGQLVLPDEDVQVAMYEECLTRLESRGLKQYEISNFAKPGRECRHNLCYWHAEEYASYGPGAVGSMDVDVVRTRYTNYKHPERYSETIEKGLTVAFDKEPLDEETLRIERIMLGLRLNDGLQTDGMGLRQKDLDDLVGRKWASLDASNLKLTKAGRHFCSEAALILMG